MELLFEELAGAVNQFNHGIQFILVFRVLFLILR